MTENESKKATYLTELSIEKVRWALDYDPLTGKGVRITNLLGVKGVQQRGKKYRALITVNYRVIHLGTFNTIGEAINARKNTEREYFGEFAE